MTLDHGEGDEASGTSSAAAHGVIESLNLSGLPFPLL